MSLLGVLVWQVSACAAISPPPPPPASLARAQTLADSGRVALPGGGSLFYEVAGGGPTVVVLLHAAFVDRRQWDAQFAARSEAGHRVYRYDARGYGRSTPVTGPFSRVDDLTAFLDGVGVARAALVGNSLGGGTALDFAVAFPDRVRRLVLVGTSVSGHAWPPGDLTAPWHRAAGAALVRGDTVGVARAWLLSEYGVGAREQPAVRSRLLELLSDNVAYWKGLLLHGDQEQEPAVPALPRLAVVRARTLVIIGDRDGVEQQAIADTLRLRLPHVERVIFPGAGHFPNLEQSTRFTQLTLALLARP